MWLVPQRSGVARLFGKTDVEDQDLELWDLVEDSYIAPKNTDCIEIPRKEMNANKKNMYKMHYKSRTFMINAITFRKFDKCPNKKTSKSIYDSLILTHEGSKQVQEAKANLLVKKYDLFKIEEDEDIETMFSRFQNLVSGLKVLEMSYTTADHLKKILRKDDSKKKQPTLAMKSKQKRVLKATT
ncbi:uncharacterized protein [Cicer arietinum]|uniref:uncharacterized protein n=1 Tax=Cicer arietinum TaxID=3827 RepID=UPI003CC53D67